MNFAKRFALNDERNLDSAMFSSFAGIAVPSVEDFTC